MFNDGTVLERVAACRSWAVGISSASRTREWTAASASHSFRVQDASQRR